MTLDVALARPAMVVLADAYDPGWRAWSNDRPLEPVAVDGALLGLYLGEGEHELRLRYRPEGWAAAGWLALVGVLCGLALLVGARRRAATRGGGGRPAPVRR
ncbi:MAG: hypothetical protein CSB49_01895 [Proteobacteria bacterium]|nr:MAG: hypothetical protein CSB49_01895 [Pseudomonadota bacterium]